MEKDNCCECKAKKRFEKIETDINKHSEEINNIKRDLEEKRGKLN